MIYLDIVGRCGNQMFQYAFAKKISLVNDNEEICIDFYHVYEEGKKRKDISFQNELKNFKATENFEAIDDGRNKIFQHGSKRQIIIFKIYRKIKRLLQKFSDDKRLADKLMYRLLSHYGIYWYYAPERIVACKESNKFIWGYFENPKYFDDIVTILCEDFTPIHKEAEKNVSMYSEINNSDTVCVSFRKWNDNEPINDDWFVCDENYYQNALSLIHDLIPDAKFVIFSNDVDWVKMRFNLPENSIFEEGNDSIYEKMRLMYSCDHFVLSNSTFAWWAQYLGKNNDKIVVSPKHWFSNEKIDNPLILPYFTKVKGRESEI